MSAGNMSSMLRVLDQDSWLDRATSDRRFLETILSDSGLDANERASALSQLDKDVGQVVRGFPESFAPLGDSWGDHGPPAPNAIEAMRSVFRKCLSRLRFEPEESVLLHREIPLCILNSPSVSGARTTYAESTARTDELGCKLQFFGSGMTNATTMAISHAQKFVSSGGDKKIIFVPLTLKATRVAVYSNTTLKKRLLKTEVVTASEVSFNGIRSADDAEWMRLSSEMHRFADFPLADDHSAAVATFKRKVNVTESHEVELGVSVFDLESSCSAKCTIEREVEITFELPAGRAYEVWRTSKPIGFVFLDDWAASGG